MSYVKCRPRTATRVAIINNIFSFSACVRHAKGERDTERESKRGQLTNGFASLSPFSPPLPPSSCLPFSLQLIKQTTGIWLAEPAARVDMPAICCNSICSDEDNDDDDDDDDDGLMTLMACVLELCHLQLVTCKTLSLKLCQTLCEREGGSGSMRYS